MIDWMIKRLDAITDNIQRVKHSQKFEDLMYIIGMVNNAFRFVILSFLSIITYGFAMLLLWCLFRG